MNEKDLPELNAAELRVLGSLIEKSIVTPDYYPMTLNSLTAACNQRSSRYPVVEYDEATVRQAVDVLKGLSLVSTAVGGGSRVTKYKHNFGTVYGVSDQEMAVMCLLLLRGPLTPGEIKSNAGRLFEFRSLEQVNDTLQGMLSAPVPFVREMQRSAGQKEKRFVQLLGNAPEETPLEARGQDQNESTPSMEDRMSHLEQELELVKARLEELIRELGGKS